MDPRKKHELGRGVDVVMGFDGGWQVRSQRLHMPWTARTGHVTGSAVMWLEEFFEAVRVTRTASGERWDLRPWQENEVMRGVFRLTDSSVEAIHSDRSQGRKQVAFRWLTAPILPIVGLAPGKMQTRWQREWGFPAVTATLVSAVIELAAAAAGVIHLIAQGMAGVSFLPPGLSWLGLLSPVLFVESVVRLKHLSAHQQPIGSVVGLPFGLVGGDESTPEALHMPEVRRADPVSGELDLWSPIHRSDWGSYGLLRFRDQLYKLEKLEASGGGWLYHFKKGDADGEIAQLRLVPQMKGARREPVDSRPGKDREPGLLATAGLTALSCMAPRDIQERWAARIEAHPLVLTLVGAGAELVGGLINIKASQPGDGPWWLVLDLFFVAEGTVRCVLLVISGRAVGSVFGLALRPLFEKWMPEDTG